MVLYYNQKRKGDNKMITTEMMEWGATLEDLLREAGIDMEELEEE